MNKKKHILDWYIDNTPSDEKEYDKGCLAAFVIVAILKVLMMVVSGIPMKKHWKLEYKKQ